MNFLCRILIHAKNNWESVFGVKHTKKNFLIVFFSCLISLTCPLCSKIIWILSILYLIFLSIFFFHPLKLFKVVIQNHFQTLPILAFGTHCLLCTSFDMVLFLLTLLHSRTDPSSSLGGDLDSADLYWQQSWMLLSSPDHCLHFPIIKIITTFIDFRKLLWGLHKIESRRSVKWKPFSPLHLILLSG